MPITEGVDDYMMSIAVDMIIYVERKCLRVKNITSMSIHVYSNITCKYLCTYVLVNRFCGKQKQQTQAA